MPQGPWCPGGHFWDISEKSKKSQNSGRPAGPPGPPRAPRGCFFQPRLLGTATISLAGAFFSPPKMTILGIFGPKMTKNEPKLAGGRAAAGGGRHACVRASLSLLVSPHSLYISHTQNRYPALRGEKGSAWLHTVTFLK